MANRPQIRTSDSALIAMIADEVKNNLLLIYDYSKIQLCILVCIDHLLMFYPETVYCKVKFVVLCKLLSGYFFVCRIKFGLEFANPPLC